MTNLRNGRAWGLLRKGIAVLRWAWRVLLVLLLLAGVFFRGPWKVDVLLTVFLLACTILPRQRRKYFWAAVGLTILALTVWVFLPDHDEGWRPFVFEKEIEAYLAKYRVPDSENAALIYENVFKQWEARNPNEPNVPKDWFTEVRKAAWRSEQHPDIAAWMDCHEPTLKRLLEGSRLKGCFFEENIRLAIQNPSETGPTGEVRQLGYLLEASANRDWAERGPEAAMEKQLTVLRMGGHLSGQPHALWALDGLAVERMALSQLNKIVIGDSLDTVHLALISKSISGLNADWRRTFEGILENEKLTTANLFGGMMYQVNAAGQVRLSRDPGAAARPWMERLLESGDIEDEETRQFLNAVVHRGYWQKKLDTASVIPGWFFDPPSPQKMIRIIDEGYQRQSIHPICEDFKWWQVQFNWEYPIELMAGISVESNQRIRSLFQRAETERHATRLIVALRRYKNEHGSWPAELAAARPYEEETAFTDSWDRPFIYKLNGDTLVLYSTGENGLDENGECRAGHEEHKRTLVPDDLMIWPERSISP